MSNDFGVVFAEQNTAQELLWHDVGELWNGFEVVYVSPNGNIFATSEQWEAIKVAGLLSPSEGYVVRKEVAVTRCCSSTPPQELERQIMSSTVPKNEREWWASREIERLRDAIRPFATLYDPSWQIFIGDANVIEVGNFGHIQLRDLERARAALNACGRDGSDGAVLPTSPREESK